MVSLLPPYTRESFNTGKYDFEQLKKGKAWSE